MARKLSDGVALLDGDESHLRARVLLRSRASLVVALIGLGLLAGATEHLLLR